MGSSALEASKGGNGKAAVSRRKLSPGPGLGAQEVAAHQVARIHDATIQLVAEHGYSSLKVRDIVRCAEVSTRAFYEHFGSKEDCFLQTYDLISRRATRRIIAAQTGESDWRRRSRLIFEEFVKELEAAPEGARLALIEAYAAGDAALVRAWRAERAFESMLAEALARTPRGVAVPPLVVQGMVAGVAAVSRSRMLSGRLTELASVGGDLVEWAMRYTDPTAARLSYLDSQSVWRDTTLEPLSGTNEEPWASSGDRALILDAVAELAAAKGYAGLTAPRIRSLARVSRRQFDSYFEDVEACYLAAIARHANEAMTQATRAQAAASTKIGGAYRAVAALCEHVASDPFFSRVCFTGDFPPGPEGARSRQRLIEATMELFASSHTSPFRPTPLATEATTGAVWSLFHHHIIRDRALRQKISATLTYLAMAPIAGAAATVTAIQGEQGP